MTGPVEARDETIFSAEALAFVADLTRKFAPRIAELLEKRRARQARFDGGELPDFLPETAEIRAGSWRVAPPPPDLRDRRVEITGPTDRKMIINALNSGARVFMADFEDSNSPTWRNLVDGQANLRDAVRRTITFKSDTGKTYALGDRTAVLVVRPRGLHLVERHMTVDGRR
ncbi:MAG: malate synthase A, partial [Polyangiaceae bacterium]|nr:malate synthase A [Polyangiaceae bacterium]